MEAGHSISRHTAIVWLFVSAWFTPTVSSNLGQTHTHHLFISIFFSCSVTVSISLSLTTHTHRHTVIDGPVMISACIVDEGHAAMVTGAVSDSPCPPVCVCRLSVFADLTLWVVASSLFIYFCILMCVFCVFVCLCNYLCLCVDVCICACMCVCLFAFCMFMCFFSCLREPMWVWIIAIMSCLSVNSTLCSTKPEVCLWELQAIN